MTQQQTTKAKSIKLSELINVRKGKKVNSSKNKTANSIPYLLIDTLRGTEPEYFTEDEKYTEAILEDVLIVADGANSGLVGTGVKGAVGSTIARLRMKVDDLDKDYLSYFLKSFFERFRADVKGSGTPHLKINKMLEMEIRKPSLNEQKQIVSALETHFSRLDNAVKNLKSVKNKIQLYRKAVLKKAFEKKEGWEEISVKNMGKIVTGKTPKTANREYYGNEYCFFRPKELNNKNNVNDSEIKLSKEGFNLLKKLPEKSVMVTCIGATIGKTGLNKVEGATNQQINSIIVNKEKFVPELLYYLFISDMGQRKVIYNSSSTTLPILNKSKFEKLSFFLPPSLATQQTIVQSIESKFSIIDKVEQAVDKSLIKAEKLRKSILKSAFEGRLVGE